MPFPTAAQNKIQRLYHWQRFDMARFEEQMKNGTVPEISTILDCRPFFNTNLLADERRKHIDWAVEVCKRHTSMSASDIQRMSRELQNPAVARL